jgi:hypothetical protein
MWGGHSCPPLLGVDLALAVDFEASQQDPEKVKVKSSGESVCPTDLGLLNPARIL